MLEIEMFINVRTGLIININLNTESIHEYPEPKTPKLAVCPVKRR